MMRKKQDEMLLHLVSLDSKVVKTARCFRSTRNYVVHIIPYNIVYTTA